MKLVLPRYYCLPSHLISVHNCAVLVLGYRRNIIAWCLICTSLVAAQHLLNDRYLGFSPCLRHKSPLNTLLSVSPIIYLSAEISHIMATSNRADTAPNPPATILKVSLLSPVNSEGSPASGTWKLSKNYSLDPRNVGFPFGFSWIGYNREVDPKLAREMLHVRGAQPLENCSMLISSF